MAAGSPLVQALTAQLAKYPSLDPKAVLGIAAHEGLSGGIGDNGTSFGPFQLHIGGALPSSIGAKGSRYAQQWAWSPAGLNYALSRIQSVAGGLKGLPAITAISTKFERPANPSAEIADAAHHYGIPVTGGQGVQLGAPAGPGAPPAAAPVGRVAPRTPLSQSPIALALQMLGFGGGGAG